MDALGCHKDTLSNALAGDTLPSLHTALNSLAADETALDEVLELYGYRLRPAVPTAANDLQTAARLSHAAGALVDAVSDGCRDHNETLAVADQLRPIVPALLALIAEADALRGAA